MTPYDAWRTNVDETNEEAWEDAVDEVAAWLSESYKEEIVSTLVNADEVLTWLSQAIEVQHHHLPAFRDLVKLAQNLRGQVEKEMKTYRDARG